MSGGLDVLLIELLLQPLRYGRLRIGDERIGCSREASLALVRYLSVAVPAGAVISVLDVLARQMPSAYKLLVELVVATDTVGIDDGLRIWDGLHTLRLATERKYGRVP